VKPRPLRESDIEKRLVQRVKEMGGEVRKVKWIGRSGAPDRLVMLATHVTVAHRAHRGPEIIDVEGVTIWVELKAPGAKPEPHQLREHARMRKMGQQVEVVDSYERVEDILK